MNDRLDVNHPRCGFAAPLEGAPLADRRSRSRGGGGRDWPGP